jgi:hypothetical protein
MDQADALASTSLSTCHGGCAPSEQDGAQGGHHSGGGCICDAASDFSGFGSECAGSGNCSKNGDTVVASRGGIEIIIEDDHRDDGDVKRNGSIDRIFEESQAVAEAAGLPIPAAAAAQAKHAIAHGHSFRCRALVEDGIEVCGVADGAPPAAVAALRRDNSTFDLMKEF